MAVVEFNGQDLDSFTINGLDIKEQLNNTDIVIAWATPTVQQTRWGDVTQRYVKYAPKNGSIRIEGRVAIEDSATTKTLYEEVVIDEDTPKVIVVQWTIASGTKKGIRFAGTFTVQGDPPPQFIANPESREYVVRDVVFLPTGGAVTVDTTTS